MRKIIIPLLIALVAAALGWRLLFQSEPGWTTRSEQALAEFEQGLDAQMKFYDSEAGGHFLGALELDPDFVAAKLSYLRCCAEDRETRQRLIDEIRQADLERLTDRERFLVAYTLADLDRDREQRDSALTDYLHSHPKDPYALWIYSNDAWLRQDLDEAAGRFRRLLKVDPNWVRAQNNLGYIAMAQGRFAEAEDLFQSYKYIAPDQANPHDSLGEMLTLVGRYEDARQELEMALTIKPDFCASYRHLMSIAVLEGALEAGPDIVSKAAQHCGEHDVLILQCELDVWSAFFEGDFEAPWRQNDQKCLEVLGDFSFLLHRMEVLTGRLQQAEEREERVSRRIAEMERETELPLTLPRGFLHHMEGARLALQGDLGGAASRFDEADSNLLFWGEGQGILKLYNRLHLALALELSGHAEAAHRVLASVEAVNPSFAAVYPQIRELFHCS